ncbi:MAG: bifunctional 3'-5' exonuclease/DNA polymerase [Actinobacteria bacterium]|nr:bifunctional 3'-5' exonuclease/DNA polymerase [Actinomycetota bacterium]MBO0834343.1 bifunctional 3'-5' exonuclease/DNA polymerase [Actinomycetota bacterium]
MRIALVSGPGSTGLLCRLQDDGKSDGPAEPVSDLPAAVAAVEAAGPVRWVWRSVRVLYPGLLRAGVRVGRCHDVDLTGALLRARDGSDEPAAAGSGQRVREHTAAPSGGSAPAQLEFEADNGGSADPAGELGALVSAHADQLARISTDPGPARFALLVAAESAGGLAAAEMTAAGLPWRADVHERLLASLLGARPLVTAGVSVRPSRLVELVGQISEALGANRPVNPDSPAQLQRALAAAGVQVSSTRSSALRKVDHPVIAPLLEYKELARLYSANGWSWLDTWVSGGRFRPEYVVGGVVSGRWASRGGGALQIPRVLRQAVVADPGWQLVVADAAQLEPRVLAALAGDRSFAQAAAEGDLYAAVAAALGGDRATAKVALLSAMYGGSGGGDGQPLALLRRRFPQAATYLEDAARAGQEGRVVRSVLGRTCPPPSSAWLALTSDPADPEDPRDPGAGAATRARGRFTRNFVVQASAADWALVMLALLRNRLAATPESSAVPSAELVFFQHDEVVVHSPADQSESVVAAVQAAAKEATRLVFGNTDVSFPMTTAVVTCYADAK